MNTPNWSDLLTKAVTEPGMIHSAYRAFHGYSIGNQLLAMMQCMAREIPLGPIATFNGWKDKGRFVRKGEKAIELCMPVTCKRTAQDADGNDKEVAFNRFVFKRNWFVLSQTEGEAVETPTITPNWEESKALTTLEVERVPFEHANGNVQGYAMPGNKLAVSPIAAMPYKTLFHELAHIVLGHVSEQLADDDTTPRNIQEVEAESVAMLCCATLELPGVEFSRGYIQGWLQGETIPERSAQRIFSATDKILKAGYSKE